MIFDDIIKRKLDLETVSLFLNEVLEKEKEKVQGYANYTSNVGKAMYDKEVEYFSILSTCKDNIDFVKRVLDDYIEKEHIQSSATHNYKPRKFTSFSDLGKYQTEVEKAKRVIRPLLWTPSFLKDADKEYLYQECINKLNYVYSHISKKV